MSNTPPTCVAAVWKGAQSGAAYHSLIGRVGSIRLSAESGGSHPRHTAAHWTANNSAHSRCVTLREVRPWSLRRVRSTHVRHPKYPGAVTIVPTGERPFPAGLLLRHNDEPDDTEDVEDENGDAVDAEAGVLLGRAKDEAGHVDDCQEGGEAGQVDVGGVGVG